MAFDEHGFRLELNAIQVGNGCVGQVHKYHLITATARKTTLNINRRLIAVRGVSL